MLLPLLLLSSLSSWSPVWDTTTPNSKRIFIEVEKTTTTTTITHSHSHPLARSRNSIYSHIIATAVYAIFDQRTWALRHGLRVDCSGLLWNGFLAFVRMYVRVYQWNPLGEQSTFLRGNNAQCKRYNENALHAHVRLYNVTACVMQTIFSRGKLFPI